MGKDCLSGRTRATTKATLLRITLRGTESTLGVIDECIRVTGRTTRWKVKAPLPGLMDDPTLESTSTIRKKVKAFSTGLTVAATMANGSTGSKMVSALTPPPAAKPKKANGVMVSALTGCNDFY